MKKILALLILGLGTEIVQAGMLEQINAYDGALRFSTSLKDPNSKYGGGVTYCHGTAIAKEKQGESCRYVVLTAAHCFESPVKVEPGVEKLPVEVTYVDIAGTFAHADASGVTLLPHPDWKDKQKHTDVALMSFVADCAEPIEIVRTRSLAPAPEEECGILTDHTERFKYEWKGGQYRSVHAPKIDARVVGEASFPGKTDTLFHLDATDATKDYLVPGDSGSGMLCDDGTGNLALTGVLVMAPHVGRRYAVESGSAVQWAEVAAAGLLQLFR